MKFEGQRILEYIFPSNNNIVKFNQHITTFLKSLLFYLFSKNLWYRLIVTEIQQI